ncbi:hypothetical protein [Streptomyces sp. NRRL WC-3742]|uniref:hypothetical protein n=1 Tax=Streptomyces sp. NRRL WC-3742 TaxID=1463934 RepID=UPI000AD0A84A|nr:hypothetical protein [Streptomyces sp. NRRL WC-3742]
MAWHLGADTRLIADSCTIPISRADLKPGDALNSYHHPVLLLERCPVVPTTPPP